MNRSEVVDLGKNFTFEGFSQRPGNVGLHLWGDESDI